MVVGSKIPALVIFIVQLFEVGSPFKKRSVRGRLSLLSFFLLNLRFMLGSL